MQNTSIKKVPVNHREWKVALGFCKDELKIFQHRLTEVAAKNTHREVLQLVEHFQNQFIIQAENIDILLHDIDEHVRHIKEELLAQAGHINKEEIPVHFLLQDRYESEHRVFEELKHEYMQFLAKIM
ncbi:MAG: hypothetical protein JST86_21175 [Bacteroidetes bacterium]|nr:hypothetical protein [Bacteroidota bacterium]